MGHDAWSCDLLDTEVPGKHLKCSALDVLGLDWDMLIAHPPCTYLANSGVRWFKQDLSRWGDLWKAAQFFKAMIDAPIDKICVENPIQHGYAKHLIGKSYSQIIQPWMFGHGETKATCLWLKGLPNLVPTNVVDGRDQRIWKLPPSSDRWKERSRTFQGIADAMANQWGNL
jgi:hypothetical protein